MSDLLSYSGQEFVFAIRPYGSLDVVVTARGRNFEACVAAHEAALMARPKGECGRDYFGELDPGLDEAGFAAAVIEAVALMDLNIDGEVAGEYRLAA